MMGRSRHPHEDRLFECYVAEQSGDAIEEKTASHLSGCDACRTRYADLTQFMDRLREEAEAETDAVFSPERLHLQQQQILRRIEHAGHPARVISFPARLVRRHLAERTKHMAPRWVAAAVAGLFVGVGVGVWLDSAAAPTPVPMTIARPSGTAAAIAAPTAPAPPPSALDVDAFLSELEAALGSPLNQELLPFDALTPRLQEISSRPLRY
jgi:hypothetical protein